MYRSLFLMLLTASFVACKPTPRTAPNPRPQQEQPAEPTQKAAEPTAPAEPAAEAPADAAALASSIVMVNSAQQGYDPMQPWQKKAAEEHSALGIYLGDGRVLTVGEILEDATYVELSLPDGSRSVAARVLKCDPMLNIGLVALARQEDMSFFETRRAAEFGEPLALNDSAELVGLIGGLNPVGLPLSVRRVEALCALVSDMPTLPEDHELGAPIMRNGKLAGMSIGHKDGELRMLSGDIIRRFLSDAPAGIPAFGLEFGSADDPVFRRYLRLPQEGGGLYVSRVLPGGAAEAAGVRAGDVITAVDDCPIDEQGRCESPLYGRYAAAVLMRLTKPMGEQVKLTLIRDGEQEELMVPLNRELCSHGVMAEQAPDSAPRYVIWGGLVFQPLTKDYLDALSETVHGDLPLPILREQRAELRGEGRDVKEAVALTLVIPTPATLGYERARFTVVTAVNGKPVHDLTELAALIDEPTADNITEISLSEAPYTLYIDRAAAEAANDRLHRTAIPNLRVLGDADEPMPIAEP